MKTKLGDLLLDSGIINQEQLEEALSEQKKVNFFQKPKLGEILIKKEYITEIQLAEIVARQLGMPYCRLDRDKPTNDAVKLLKKEDAERLKCIPIMVEGNTLTVAMSDPFDINAQDELRRITGLNLRVAITTATDIKNNIEKIYDIQVNLTDAVSEVEEFERKYGAKGGVVADDNTNVSRLVWGFLNNAVREGASDIHLECYEDVAWVRYRIDGRLSIGTEYPKSLHRIISSKLKNMSGMDMAETRKPQDGRLLLKIDGRQIDFRVSSLPTLSGEKIVLRILDQESAMVGLERLGLGENDMKQILKFCEIPWGILLVTGPTGSGKSTTLYSMLHRMNKPDVNITTVEDPVEFTVKAINQVHVNEKAGMTFPNALRSILRQDPDKIMIGEIRDGETAQIAIRSALTGHLVLSTLHTNDAPSTPSRLIDMGIPPFLVANSLVGIIAQRLVRRLCPYCKQELIVDARTSKDSGIPEGTKIWSPKGCNSCRGGYKGRIGLYEIMPITPEIRHEIMKATSDEGIRAAGTAAGMTTLRDAGIRAVLNGYTSLEEVMTATI